MALKRRKVTLTTRDMTKVICLECDKKEATIFEESNPFVGFCSSSCKQDYKHWMIGQVKEPSNYELSKAIEPSVYGLVRSDNIIKKACATDVVIKRRDKSN